MARHGWVGIALCLGSCLPEFQVGGSGASGGTGGVAGLGSGGSPGDSGADDAGGAGGSAGATDGGDAGGAEAGCDGSWLCDPASCGAPGHDCLGGACLGGVCQPIQVAPAVDNYGDHIAVRGSHFYFAGGLPAGLYACPLAGCAADNSKRVTLTLNQPGIADIVPFATDLYWSSATALGWVRRCPLPLCGGVSEKILDVFEGGITALALDKNRVYVATPAAIRSCPLLGCGGSEADLLTALPSAGVTSLAVTATELFWPLGGTVWHCPLSGCGSPVALSAGASPLLVEWDRVYFASALPPYQISSCPASGCDSDAGDKLMATAGGVVWGLAIDATSIYWTEELGAGADGKVAMASKKGGPTSVLAVGQAGPRGVATDDKAIYWINQGVPGVPGSVMRLAK